MRKSQEYATGTIIYLLVFFTVLLVGTYGIHNRFLIESRAKSYQLTALSAEEVVKDVKQLVGSERRYALERSLFLVGAFGGYNAPVDLQKIPDCEGGDKNIINLTYCRDPNSGEPVPATNFKYRNINIRECGTTPAKYEGGFSSLMGKIMPEREYGVPYFYDSNFGECPASYNLDIDVLKGNIENVSKAFAELDPDVYNYIKEKYGRFIDIDKYYVLKIQEIDDDGIKYVWYPVNKPRITVYDGPNPANSSVVYSEPFAITGFINSSFGRLFNAVKEDASNVGDIDEVIDSVLDKKNLEFDFVNSECNRSFFMFLVPTVNEDGQIELVKKTYSKLECDFPEDCASVSEETDRDCLADCEEARACISGGTCDDCYKLCTYKKYSNIDEACLIRSLTDGKYESINNFGKAVYKRYLDCEDTETLEDCIRRKVLERLSKKIFVGDKGGVSGISKKILMDSFDVKNIEIITDYKKNYYYKPREYYGAEVSIKLGGASVFSAYGKDYDVCTLVAKDWPSFLDDPGTAEKMASSEYYQVKDRKAFYQRKIDLTVKNTGDHNIKGVKIEVIGFGKDSSTSLGSREYDVDIAPGESSAFRITANFTTLPAVKKCFNPNFR